MEIQKKRKSVVITKEEIKALKGYLKEFRTKAECAERIGVSPQVLDRALQYESAAPETVEKIRLALL